MLAILESQGVLARELDEQFVDDAGRLQHRLRRFAAEQRSGDQAQARIDERKQRFRGLRLTRAPKAEQFGHVSFRSHWARPASRLDGTKRRAPAPTAHSAYPFCRGAVSIRARSRPAPRMCRAT